MPALKPLKFRNLRIPLRFKFGFPFVLSVLIATFLIWYISSITTSRSLVNLTDKLLRQSNERVITSIQSFMEVPKSVGRLSYDLYLDGTLPVEDPVTFNKILFDQLKQQDSIMAIEYADENKNDIGPVRNVFDLDYGIGFSGESTNYSYRLYAADDNGLAAGDLIWELENYDPTQRDWYLQGKNLLQESWTPLYLWPNGDVGLDFVKPIIKDGAFRGVFLTSYTIGSITNYLETILPTDNSQILLLEDTGYVISGSNIKDTFFNSSEDGFLVRKTMGELNNGFYKDIEKSLVNMYGPISSWPNEVITSVSVSELTYLVSVSRVLDETGLSWIVLTIVPESDYLIGVSQIRKSASIATFILSLVALLLAGFVAKRITSPISKLSEAAKEIAAGHLDVSVDIDSNDEVGNLGKSFNTMSSRIKSMLVDLKSREEAALREKDKLNALLHNMGDGVFVLDKDKKIVLVNQATLDLAELTEEECLNKPYRDVLLFVRENDHENINDDFIDAAYETKEIQEMSNHTVLLRKDGAAVPVSDSASPLLDSAGNVTGCVIVFRDVSKERKIDLAKDEFIALASHQLRTPLTSIMWHTELLADKKTGDLSPRQKEVVGNIQKGNKRMSTLIDALLTSSNIELNRLVVNPEAISVKDMLDRILSDYKLDIEEKGLKFDMNVPKELDACFADKNLFTLVFDNVISNAIKYSYNNGKIYLDVSKDDENLIFDITDEGIGIPKDQQSRIFDKLFRGDNAREIDTIGTGLGLYIGKLAIIKMGGAVWFESELGKGTTFHIRLPINAGIFKGFDNRVTS